VWIFNRNAPFVKNCATGNLKILVSLFKSRNWAYDGVVPDYGQSLPWYFPFSPSCWCPGTARIPQEDETKEVNQDIPNEPVGQALLRQKSDGKSIEIHQLRKQFGEKNAVDGLNLSMYNGQITALLVIMALERQPRSIA
jgi:hypothetical protein